MERSAPANGHDAPPELTEQVDMLGGGFSFVVTREQLGEVLDLSSSMLDKLRDEGMPQQRRGVYDLRACVQWYIEKWRRARPAEGESEMTTRAALNVAQRERIELETARTRGELLPFAEVRALVQVLGAIIAARLEGLAPRMADQLAGKGADQVRAELASEARSIREQLAAAVREAGPALVDALEGPAPAKAQRKARRAKVAA